MVAKLTDVQRAELLPTLSGWTLVPARDALRRSFVFADFAQAFAFMTEVALHAQQLDHHPEWTNVWNRVDVVLTTHDAKGLSLRDVGLAARIDAAAARIGARPQAEPV